MVKASLKEIINIITEVNLLPDEITFFCNDIKTINDFREESENQDFDIEKFLLEHENNINKDEFLLLVIKMLQINIDLITNKLLKNPLLNEEQKGKALNNIIYQQKLLDRLLKLATKINCCISEYDYDNNKNQFFVKVTNSKEILKGKEVENDSAIEYFDNIDSKFQMDDTTIGLENALQVVLLTDFYEVFPNLKMGIDIRTMIIENEILKRGIKTFDELQEIKTQDISKYNEVENSFELNDETLIQIKLTLREYSQYLNLDKLLLICAYRFNDALENEKVEIYNLEDVKKILNTILESLKNEHISLSCKLQKPQNSYLDDEDVELCEVNYSIHDLKRCISKFTEFEYITEEKCKQIKEDLLKGNIHLDQISTEGIKIIFPKKEELEKYSMLNESNFLFVALNNNWDTKRIENSISKFGSCSFNTIVSLLNNQKIDVLYLKELYFDGVISLETISKINEQFHLNKIVNLDELMDYYRDRNINNIDEEEKIKREEKLNKYIELYKALLIDNEGENSKIEISEDITMNIIEKTNNKETSGILKMLFQKGLIIIDSIADWCGINMVEEFFKENLINLDDIIKLGKKRKISIEFVVDKIKDVVEDINIEDDEKLKYLKMGFLDSEYICELYKKNIIFEKDFEELGKLGVISSTIVNSEIKYKKREDAEAESYIKITGISNLEKLNSIIYSNDSDGSRNVKVKNEIIDPIKREEYIRMLNAYRAETDIKPGSAFYNYDFYVIPEENGEIGLNSVVIAERYYENKETEDKFAINNATYFFKYKDLIVLSKRPKSEMIKERDGIVFISKHIMASEKRVGSWASSVLYNLIKTKLSSSLNEYSKANTRLIVVNGLEQLYSREELINIFDLGTRIDKGEYNCEILEEGNKKRKKTDEAR